MRNRSPIMEDMPARNTRLGSTRPPSSSLVVQVRCHGLLFAFALTGFALVLLSQLDTAEANAYVRSPLQNGGEEETEVLQQRQLAKGVLPSPMPRYDPERYEYNAARTTRVQCVYFTEWPPHTYCHLRNTTGFYTFDDADKYCQSIAMSVLSMIYTPMYRICRLIRLFGIKDHRLWVEDIVHQPGTLGWEDCYFRAENETKPPVNCNSCNVSIICMEDSNHSNSPTCVTRAEGNNDVEYCYKHDKVSATEASKRCAQHSSLPVETEKTDREVTRNLYSVLFFNQEAWVDLKEEDLSELSGVVSMNFAEIDWNSSCTTVWLNRRVPWFFLRNCSDLYPVVCEANDRAKDQRYDYYSHGFIDDCGEKNWLYCFSGVRTFNKTTGSEFCANYTFSLLNGKSLRTLYFVRTRYSTYFHRPELIWYADGMSNRENNSNTCYAVSVEGSYKVIEYNCSEKLGYVCKSSKPRVTHGFDCEYANMARSSRRPVCVSNVGKNFPESEKQCAKLGMALLPAGLDHKEYTAIVNNYFLLYMVPRPHSALWVDIPQRMNSDSCSVMSDWETFSFHSAECEENVGSTVCVFSNK